jgi:hypothetical protein
MATTASLKLTADDDYLALPGEALHLDRFLGACE